MNHNNTKVIVFRILYEVEMCQVLLSKPVRPYVATFISKYYDIFKTEYVHAQSFLSIILCTADSLFMKALLFSVDQECDHAELCPCMRPWQIFACCCTSSTVYKCAVCSWLKLFSWLFIEAIRHGIAEQAKSACARERERERTRRWQGRRTRIN